MKRTYFPGLNTIRLYAAFCVVFGHTAEYPPEMGYVFATALPSQLNFIILTGYEAVSLFFVLSGFLITYFLLDEYSVTGTIAVKQFYIKRALRIQPLYGLITLLTLVVPIVVHPSDIGLLAIVVLSPHLAMHSLGAAFHLWSIGVEEWFYLALPPLLRRISVPALALSVIGLRLLLAIAIPDLMLGNPYAGNGMITLHALRFECMAIGALGAWMLINRHWLLKWIYRAELPNLAMLTVIILLNFPGGGVAFNLVSSCVFLVFILNAATNPNRKLSLELPIFASWGAVTYGVYMYHPLVLRLIAAALVRIGLQNDVLLYIAVGVAVLVVALVSHRVFELPIMRWRKFGSAEMTPIIGHDRS